MTNAVNLASAAGTGFLRNRIMNGDMRIDQRNAGSAVTVSTDPVYVLDRWRNSANGGGAFSVQRVADAPAGFTYSQKGTVTTADTSIASNDYYSMNQVIEGFNIADLNWGTANAVPVTFSFWVKASISGTYCAVFFNGTTFDRSYVAPYSITAANTWEYKTVTLPGAPSGSWDNTNGTGIYVAFILGSGSGRRTTTPNTWLTSFAESTAAQTQWIGTNSATFQVTGVQFEAGTAATPFERRPYGLELALCSRFFLSFASDTFRAMGYSAGSGGNASLTASFPVKMRAAPTASSSYSASSLIGNGPFIGTTVDGFNVTNNTSGAGYFNFQLGVTTFNAEL